MNFTQMDLYNKICKRRTFLKHLAAGSCIPLSGAITGRLFAQEPDSSSNVNGNRILQREEYPLKGVQPMKALILCVSIHHQNTAKIATAISSILEAPVKSPSDVTLEELTVYDIIGFGSGIYSQKHHHSILDFVELIPNGISKKAFIFSTSGISRKFACENSIDDPHTVIRQLLQRRNWPIAGEFNCTGWNTNSFLKIFGGMNKGKPDLKDLSKAEMFARGIVSQD